MRAIVIRHYKTQANQAGRILGWGDSPPLADWKSKAERMRRRFDSEDIRFDAVFASDLERARVTARLFAEKFGIADVVVAPELREINYGQVQTRRKRWVINHYPEHKKDPDLVYPGGESFHQMQRRSVDFLSSLLPTLDGKTAFIVSHAGVIRGLISHFLGLEFARCLKQSIPFGYIGDFVFDTERCQRYRELGKPSGFAHSGAFELPWSPD